LLKLPEAERVVHPQYAAAVTAAIRVPQATAGFALNVLEHCLAMLDKTNKMLLSDLAIAAVYAHATVQASEMNVRVNLPLLPDRAEAEAARGAMAELVEKAGEIHAALRMEILRRL
jgi:formiminotetrahydrofolate cyclodeaminase